MNKQKILLVPGHCISGEMGAFSKHLNTFEQKYNSKVAEYLRNKYPADYDIYYHTINGYTMRQTALSNLANKLNYKAVAELHFNSFNQLAQGTETLYFHSSAKGKQYAQIVQNEITKEYGLFDRGIKPISKGGRGYAFLQKMKAVALIIEPFFGDEEKCTLFENIQRYADTLHKAFKQL